MNVTAPKSYADNPNTPFVQLAQLTGITLSILFISRADVLSTSPLAANDNPLKTLKAYLQSSAQGYAPGILDSIVQKKGQAALYDTLHQGMFAAELIFKRAAEIHEPNVETFSNLHQAYKIAERVKSIFNRGKDGSTPDWAQDDIITLALMPQIIMNSHIEKSDDPAIKSRLINISNAYNQVFYSDGENLIGDLRPHLFAMLQDVVRGIKTMTADSSKGEELQDSHPNLYADLTLITAVMEDFLTKMKPNDGQTGQILTLRR